jgi:hypothetical protein
MKALMKNGNIYEVEKFDEVAGVIGVLSEKDRYKKEHPVLTVYSLEEVRTIIDKDNFIFINGEKL